jgi:uncharacterized protein (DUF2126 family)
MELRAAIEPWNVLGEDVTAQGTARFVDSSVERMQVKVQGMTDDRHVLASNGRRVPLRPTGRKGEFVAGVRFKAWSPPSGLHPTIPAQEPLIFEIIDTWNRLSLGGCTYHGSHPGGRSEDRFPVNSYEAETRRIARFRNLGHSSGTVVAAVAQQQREDVAVGLDGVRAQIALSGQVMGQEVGYLHGEVGRLHGAILRGMTSPKAALVHTVISGKSSAVRCR